MISRLTVATGLFLATIFVSANGAQADDERFKPLQNESNIRVTGVGPTEADAKQDAIRLAMQQAFQQLIVTDRLIKDDHIVRDKIMSTMNGYIERFTPVAVRQSGQGVSVDADVVVSSSKITNFIAQDKSLPAAIDGGSLFAEAQREIGNRKAKGEIFAKLLEGYPSRVMKAQVERLAPDDKSPGDFLVKVKVSYDDGWVSALKSGLRELSALAIDVHGTACEFCNKFNAEFDGFLSFDPALIAKGLPKADALAPRACVYRWPEGSCFLLAPGDYTRSLTFFPGAPPRLLLAVQVIDSAGVPVMRGKRSCLVKSIGAEWLSGSIEDQRHDNRFSFLVDTSPPQL